MIGRNCKIGDHVQIVNSTLLDNVIVEDGWVNVPKVLYYNPHPNPITPPTLTPKLNPKTLEGQEEFNNTQSVLKCNDILFYILSKCTKNVHQLICIGWLVNIRVYTMEAVSLIQNKYSWSSVEGTMRNQGFTCLCFNNKIYTQQLTVWCGSNLSPVFLILPWHSYLIVLQVWYKGKHHQQKECHPPEMWNHQLSGGAWSTAEHDG